ncbi:cysteine hydrolase family protein [Microbacterium sp. LjRoot45]|uniref:cysteine hydrolase family protein n=1 Tax=Microbacterium sp. LjRoot45 TaxID=3342329 RepID=UPI003ECD3A39
MSRFPDRDATALVVIDMQRGVVAGNYEVEAVTRNVAALVERARADGVPVVWVQDHNELEKDSPEWQLVDGLVPAEGEARVDKIYGDSFEDTDLDERLAERGVDRLVVAGAQTDACIRSTLHGALTRGYDVTLVSDAHTTEDLRQWGSPISPEQAVGYANLYWSFSRTPDAAGDVTPTAEVAFTR